MATVVPSITSWTAKSLYASLLNGYNMRVPMENAVWHKFLNWKIPEVGPQAAGPVPIPIGNDIIHSDSSHDMHLRSSTRLNSSISISNAIAARADDDDRGKAIHSDARLHMAHRNYNALTLPPLMRYYQLATLYNAHTTATRVRWFESHRHRTALDLGPHVKPGQLCFFCAGDVDGLRHLFTDCEVLRNAVEEISSHHNVTLPPASISRMVLLCKFASTRDLNFLALFQFVAMQVRKQLIDGYHKDTTNIQGVVTSHFNAQAAIHLKRFPDPRIPTTKAAPRAAKAPSPKRQAMAKQMLALINAAGDDDVLCFTDGSRDCERARTGGGIAIFLAGVPISQHSFALADSTNNEAEFFSLGALFDRLCELIEEGVLPRTAKFLMFTDSEYCFDLLMGNSIPHINIHLAHHTIRKLKALKALAPATTLHWLPGHLAISGNDAADKLAKAGASMAHHHNPGNFSVIDRVFMLYDSDDSFFTHYTAHPVVGEVGD
jgi:ribonuclease HI